MACIVGKRRGEVKGTSSPSSLVPATGAVYTSGVMRTTRQAVLAYLKGADRAIGATLSTLVRIPTVNPYSGDPAPAGEANGQAFLARQMRGLGGVTRFVPVPRDVYRRAGILGPRERDWTHRWNLVGRFRFGTGANPCRIVLNGHMDTVGVSDFEGEPFSGRRRGDRIFGRGASDCKAGLTAALFAIRALRASGAAVNAEILFESVVDEECNGAGAGTLACCLAGIRGDYCLLLDGMAGLIYTGCQGILTAEITVRGRAGHGSLGGVNAVEKLLVAKRAIDELSRDRARRHPDFLANVGVIRAGLAPWTVPNRGWLAANINYAYEEAEASKAAGRGFCGALVRRDLEKRLAKRSRADSWLRRHPPKLVWAKDAPPCRMEDSGQPEACRRLLAAVTRAFRSAWGRAPLIGELHAWSDASHLARVGRMPMVGMGAGEGGAAHTATEWNRVSNVRRTAAAVALAILELAGAPEM